MIKILCSACRQRYTVSVEQLGSKVRCSVCNTVFVAEAAIICPRCSSFNFPSAPECAGCGVPFIQPGEVAAQDGDALAAAYGFLAPAAVSMPEATIFTALRRFDDFSGRSSRQEFWLMWLFILILRVGFYLLALVCEGAFAGGFELVAALEVMVSFVLLVPLTAAGVRRLHDTGRSGWLLLLNLIPLLGGLVLIFWFCEDSGRGENIYGANPKGEG